MYVYKHPYKNKELHIKYWETLAVTLNHLFERYLYRCYLAPVTSTCTYTVLVELVIEPETICILCFISALLCVYSRTFLGSHYYNAAYFSHIEWATITVFKSLSLRIASCSCLLPVLVCFALPVTRIPNTVQIILYWDSQILWIHSTHTGSKWSTRIRGAAKSQSFTEKFWSHHYKFDPGYERYHRVPAGNY